MTEERAPCGQRSDSASLVKSERNSEEALRNSNARGALSGTPEKETRGQILEPMRDAGQKKRAGTKDGWFDVDALATRSGNSRRCSFGTVC